MKICYRILPLLFILNTWLGAGPLTAQTKLWTMKQCIDYAWDQNILLKQSELASKLNRVNLDQARMNVYPAFSVNDAQNFDFGDVTNQITGQMNYQSIAANNLALNGSMILYNGFQLRNTIKQSKQLYDAGNFDIAKMKNDIILNVMADYLQVIYTYKAIEIARQQRDGTQTQVERTQKFVDVGKLAEGNLLQVQSQLASDNAAVVNAENQLQIAKVTLMQLMEIPITDDFEVDSSGINQPTFVGINPSADIYKTAEGIMPEIKSAELNTKASATGIKIAHALFLPKLSLGGNINTSWSSGNYQYATTTTYQQQDVGFLQNNPAERVLGLVPVSVTQKQNYSFGKQLGDNFGQALSLSLNIPIFTNFQAKYSVERAKISFQNTQLNEQATRDKLRKLVELACTDFSIAQKNYLAAIEIMKAEERSYSDMEKKFILGLATATDFLIEKNNYERTQQLTVQSKFTYIFKSKIVDFYLGKPLN